MSKRSAKGRRGRSMIEILAVCLGFGSLSCAEGVNAEDAPLEWETSVNDLKGKGLAWQQEYFEIRADYRKCASPLCGGYFVKALNRRWTRCADGSWSRECYVAELNFSGTLPVAEHVVVQGRIESNVFPDFGDLGSFAAEDAWGSATAATPTGTFYRVSSSGIVCITTPCPTVTLERLNSPRQRRVSDYDLQAAGATEEQLEAATAAFVEGDLIVSGRVRVLDPDLGPSLIGSQFFLSAIAASCKTDEDCGDGEWCRQTEAGGLECVPFAVEGESCNGFTLPWYYEQCAPELVCDVPDYVADAPGVCRAPCKDNEGCSEEEYCASGVCRDDGTCETATHCLAEGNQWPHIACVGYPACPLFGDGEQCGWDCGVPQCIDVRGVDFGPCDAVLGYGVYFDQCVQLSGCDAQGTSLFSTLEECQAACEQ